MTNTINLHLLCLVFLQFCHFKRNFIRQDCPIHLQWVIFIILDNKKWSLWSYKEKGIIALFCHKAKKEVITNNPYFKTIYWKMRLEETILKAVQDQRVVKKFTKGTENDRKIKEIKLASSFYFFLSFPSPFLSIHKYTKTDDAHID